MTIEVTPHGRRPKDGATTIDALDAQIDDMFVVADNAESVPFDRPGLVRIVALTDGRVRIGPPGADANTGARMFVGSAEVYWVAAGEVVAWIDL